MFKSSIVFTIVLLLSVSGVFAQSKGVLQGTIRDNSNNEALIGANVILVGTSFGASTDLDGKYSIKSIPAGKYSVTISYISYKSVTVSNVEISEGKPFNLSLGLEPAFTEIEEVVVTAEALKSTEASLLKIQKNSVNIVDGLSAEMIKKTNSSDGTDILKKMTGVTIADGKYAFIRGVSERYNNTLLNGASLPSTDPEKRSFSYDMFPASLIENMITSKSFTPDKPGDFSGGLVEISTIEFPEKFIVDGGYSTSINSITSFKNFKTYASGKSDYLGFDDGSRDIPSLVPDSKLNRSTPNLDKISKSFSNNWNTENIKALNNNSFKLNMGNKFEFGEDQILGFIASANYGQAYESRDIISKASYSFEGPRYDYSGSSSTYSVNWSAMLNTSYKFGGTNKISFKNMYTVNADDETTFYKGNYYSSNQSREVTSLRYISRNMYSSQLVGSHSFSVLNGINWNWNVNFARSSRNEPDLRRYVYYDDLVDPLGKMKLDMTNAYPSRFYGNLVDNNRGIGSGVTFRFFMNPALPNLKTGFNLDVKGREFDARSFAFKNNSGIADSILESPVETIFQEKYFNTNPTRGIAIQEDTKASDSYSADQSVNAVYMMTEFEPLEKLKVVTGVRYEASNQKMKTVDMLGNAVNLNAKYGDYLPAISLTYLLSEDINLRFAGSKTLARPEFRELAPFQYFDFLANELVEGNPDLKRATISNYDVRAEFFTGPGELIAISLFYKNFKNPIEQVFKSASSFEPIRTFANATSATNAGLELEIRKNLGLTFGDFQGTNFLSNLSFVGNGALISSKVDGIGTGFQESSRPLQGQANYIVNAGLYYDNAEDGLSASVSYNRIGEKIAKVGFAGLGDVIELPRNQIDLSFGKTLAGGIDFKIGVKDILAEDYVQVQKSPIGDKDAERYNRGRTITAGISYRL